MAVKNTKGCFDMTNKDYIPCHTYTGRLVNLADFQETDIDLRDIAVSLSRQNRYAGHSAVPWSVGQHLMLCGAMAQAAGVSDTDTRCIFLHDIEETWVQDVIWPVKTNLMLGRYSAISDNVSKKVYSFFGLADDYANADTRYLLKTFDRAAYIIEGFQLIPGFVHNQDDFHNDVNALVKQLVEQEFSIPQWLWEMDSNTVAQELFEILNVFHAETVLGQPISAEVEVEDDNNVA